VSSAAYSRHKKAHEAFSYVKRITVLRQMDVTWLKMLADGCVLKDLAIVASISEQQVKNRLQSIRLFMGVATTTHAVANALRKGIIR